MLPRGVTYNKLQLQYAREREPCLHLSNVVSFPAVQFCEINKIVPYQYNARTLHLNQTISRRNKFVQCVCIYIYIYEFASKHGAATVDESGVFDSPK